MYALVRESRPRLTGLRALRAAVAIMPIGLGACSTVGTTSIEEGRTPYNQVIQDTARQQTLLNIVRVANSESPLFMDVTEVDAATTLQGSIVGGPSGLGASPNFKATSGTIAGAVGFVTGGAQYEEAPTVRYQPLSGQPLIAQVSTPLTVDALASLYPDDWSLAALLRLSIDRLTPSYLDYAAAVNAIADLDEYGAIIIAATKSHEKDTPGRVIINPSPEKNDSLSIYYEPAHILVSQARCDVPSATSYAEEKAVAEKITNALWTRLWKIFNPRVPKVGKVITFSTKGSVDPGKEHPPILLTRSAFGILKDAAEYTGSQPVAIMDPGSVAELISEQGNSDCDDDFYMLYPTDDGDYRYSKRLTPEQMKPVLQRLQERDGSLLTMYPDKSSLSDGETEVENYFTGARRFMLIAKSEEPPPNGAFVSVKQNGEWYYIRSDDKISKRTLALITQFDTILAVPTQSAPLTPSISVGARQ
jgi:hypothetical protein